MSLYGVVLFEVSLIEVKFEDNFTYLILKLRKYPKLSLGNSMLNRLIWLQPIPSSHFWEKLNQENQFSNKNNHKEG